MLRLLASAIYLNFFLLLAFYININTFIGAAISPSKPRLTVKTVAEGINSYFKDRNHKTKCLHVVSFSRKDSKISVRVTIQTPFLCYKPVGIFIRMFWNLTCNLAIKILCLIAFVKVANIV